MTDNYTKTLVGIIKNNPEKNASGKVRATQKLTAKGNKYELVISSFYNKADDKIVTSYETAKNGEEINNTTYTLNVNEKSIKQAKQVLANDKNIIKFLFYNEIFRDCGTDFAPRRHIKGYNWNDGFAINIMEVKDVPNNKFFLTSKVTGKGLDYDVWTYLEIPESVENSLTTNNGLFQPRKEYADPEIKLLSLTDDILDHYIKDKQKKKENKAL